MTRSAWRWAAVLIDLNRLAGLASRPHSPRSHRRACALCTVPTTARHHRAGHVMDVRCVHWSRLLALAAALGGRRRGNGEAVGGAVHEERAERAVRAPLVGHCRALLHRRQLLGAERRVVERADALAHAEVAERKAVGACHGEDERHVGRPRADAADAREHVHHVVVVHGVQRIVGQRRVERVGHGAHVLRLALRQAGAAEVVERPRAHHGGRRER
mmetsp:Transcript_53504/g.131041  ORF Transcript_53504/g.131041 Transcript_53504/m.131041 type:complete len:216 (-) Transcript_53504:25-672(-)